MTKPSRRTEWGTPVGTATGIVHLFSQIAGTRTLGLCGRSLQGDLAIRADDEPSCPACVDQRDLAAAGLEKGFEHDVSVRRVQLGYGTVSGAGMRYGAEVRCRTHRDENGHATTVWRSNNPGQLDKARKIADQHLLTAYREYLATTNPTPVAPSTRSLAPGWEQETTPYGHTVWLNPLHPDFSIYLDPADGGYFVYKLGEYFAKKALAADAVKAVETGQAY